MNTIIIFAEINNLNGLNTSYCKENKDYSTSIALSEYVYFDNLK